MTGAREVTVACCQLAPVFGDVEANRALLAEAVAAAASDGAGVVVLPELANTGYMFESLDEARSVAEPVDGPTVREWRALANAHGVLIAGGLAENAGTGTLHNSAVLVDGSGVLARYRKAHLWDREPEWFEPGSEPPPVVDTEVGRVGLLVCYDLEFPEWTRTIGLSSADLVCVPVNWPLLPRPDGERPIEMTNAQAAAYTNGMFVAVCDRAGRERGCDWVGGSVVIGPDGYPLTPLALGTPATVAAHVDLSAAESKAVGERNDLHADRRPHLYRRVVQTQPTGRIY
ncbi:MAG: hydrolase [Pseudonocardia sp.]|nr:hydrolase [Pseudonocardia sp.]